MYLYMLRVLLTRSQTLPSALANDSSRLLARAIISRAATPQPKSAWRRRMHAATPTQRLREAWILTRRAYGENLEENICMDRTVFSMRKHPL